MSDYKNWTTKEDFYLTSHIGKYTTRMIAEDLGRTKSSVENRIKYLKASGVIFSPRKPGIRTNAEMAGEDYTSVKHITPNDRDMLRDEIQKHLTHLVAKGKMTLEEAVRRGQYINQRILTGPDYRVQDCLSMPVARIVQEAA